MDSICRFVPNKEGSGDIQTVHFVYETELHKLKQPFFRPIYYVNLVVAGSGTLKFEDCEYPLNCGTLFFMFPGVYYTIDATDDFEFIYISFMGNSAAPLLASFGISQSNLVYHNFTHTLLWSDAIRRITPANANLLTESVLYYTLSLVQSEHNGYVEISNDRDLLATLKSYVDIHYREQDISLGKISQMLSYSEKYLSAFFKKNMSIKFTEYLNMLRTQYATGLLVNDGYSISQISAMCRYSDPMYFSKVFKNRMGCTSTEYKRKYEDKLCGLIQASRISTGYPTKEQTETNG